MKALVLAIPAGIAAFVGIRALPDPVPPVSPPTSGSWAVVHFIDSLVGANFQEVASRLDTNPFGEPHQTAAWAALFSEWISADPVSARGYVESTPGFGHTPTFLDAWATHDLGAALSAARGFGSHAVGEFLDRQWNSRAALAVLLTPDERSDHGVEIERDPLRSLEAALETGYSIDHFLIQEYAISAPAPLFEAIKMKEDPQQRVTDLHAFIGCLDGSVPSSRHLTTAAFSLIPPGRDRSEKMTQFARSIANADPAAAQTWAQSFPPGAARDAAVAAVVTARADADPAALFAYLDGTGWRTDLNHSITASKTASSQGGSGSGSFSDGSFKYALRDAFQSMIDQGEIATALAHASNMHDRDAAAWTLSETFQHWANADPRTTLAFLKGAPDHELRNTLAQSVFGQIVQSNPDDAVSWWSDLPTSQQKSFQENLTRSLSYGSPSTAAALAEEFHPLFATPSSHAQLMDHWARSDPGAASQWAATLRQSPHRDAVVGKLVETLTSSDGRDLDAAVRWAETISDPSARTLALDRIEKSLKP